MVKVLSINCLKATFLMVLIASAVFSAKPDRPNIIYLMCDDLGQEWISSYGADEIKTPNIDKLAETGLQFNGIYSMPALSASETQK